MEMLVKQDESLTRSAFLLAFDLRKERLTQRSDLGYLLRAATLSELLLAGNLADKSGKAHAVTAPASPTPLQRVVWEQISKSPARSWRHWVRKDHTKAYRLVRDELAAERLIRVERRRILLFPIERVTPRKAYLSRRLAERTGRAISSGRPVGSLDQDVRVLAALAAAARLKAVLEPARHNKARIERMADAVEPVATALRKTVDAAAAAASAG